MSFFLESTLTNIEQVHRNQGVETLHIIQWFSLLHIPVKIYIIYILNFNFSLCCLVGGESPVFSRFRPYSIFNLLFFYFLFCQSRAIVSCQLPTLAQLFLWNFYRNLTITSPLLSSLVKFLTVQNKPTFRNNGLFHIIYAEEYTNFLVNFEDS